MQFFNLTFILLDKIYFPLKAIRIINSEHYLNNHNYNSLVTVILDALCSSHFIVLTLLVLRNLRYSCQKKTKKIKQATETCESTKIRMCINYSMKQKHDVFGVEMLSHLVLSIQLSREQLTGLTVTKSWHFTTPPTVTRISLSRSFVTHPSHLLWKINTSSSSYCSLIYLPRF